MVSPGRPEGPVHWNITCDFCKQMPVRGPCHRCVDCGDFDVCERPANQVEKLEHSTMAVAN